jgi:DNA-binding response OmpR family regulator
MLLDVNMPGMDGFELLRRIKRDPHLCDTPIVMLTASGMSRDVVEALEIGAADYITKPFSPAELMARVRRIMRDSDARIQPEADEPLRSAS